MPRIVHLTGCNQLYLPRRQSNTIIDVKRCLPELFTDCITTCEGDAPSVAAAPVFPVLSLE